MTGKIFYRERCKAKSGSKSPRFRVVAVSGCELKVYGQHFRKTELKQIAGSLDAELVALERGEKSNSK